MQTLTNLKLITIRVEFNEQKEFGTRQNKFEYESGIKSSPAEYVDRNEGRQSNRNNLIIKQNRVGCAVTMLFMQAKRERWTIEVKTFR